MEYIFAFVKEVLLVPLWALIQSPLVRFSARVAAASTVSLRAAFLLGLITGAVALVVSFVLFPLYSLVGNTAAYVLTLIAATAATAWSYGYFLRDPGGNSIGTRRGLMVFALAFLMLLGILLAFAVLVVLAEGVLS